MAQVDAHPDSRYNAETSPAWPTADASPSTAVHTAIPTPLVARADDLIELLQQRNCPDCPLADIDLVYADLRDVDLQEAQLQRANLGQARLDGADLRGSNLQFTNLRGGHPYAALI